MKIIHIRTGVVLEVVKEQVSQYRCKVVENPNTVAGFRIGMSVIVGKATMGITHEVAE